jgi:hypothetical protein
MIQRYSSRQHVLVYEVVVSMVDDVTLHSRIAHLLSIYTTVLSRILCYVFVLGRELQFAICAVLVSFSQSINGSFRRMPCDILCCDR